MRISSDAARDIYSLATRGAGVEITIANVGSFPITLKHDYVSGTTAAQRFRLPGDIIIAPNQAVRLFYDGTASRWGVMAPATIGIPALSAETALADDDLFPVYDTSDSTTDKITAEALAAYFASKRFLIRQDSSRTLTSSTSEQQLFNSATNGRLTLPTGTYMFDCQFVLTSMSGTSGNAAFDLLGAGGATLGTILYHAVGADGASGTAATQTGSTMVAAQSAAALVTAGTGTALQANLKGTFEVTSAGTIVPSVTLLTAASAVVAAGSYFRCERIGDNSLTTIGPWD